MSHLPSLPPAPAVYLITDRRKLKSSPGSDLVQDLIEFIDRAFASGIDMVQIRERDLPARIICQIALAASKTAARYSGKVLVNDRADVAAAAGVGVHLTTRSVDVDAIRRSFGKDLLIGASTHSLLEAVSAEQQGADFLVFGPVFETESKRVYGSPVGVDALAKVKAKVGLPVFALGGITLSNYRQPLDAGAAGVAGISLFAESSDLSAVMTAIKGRSNVPAQ